MSLSRHAWLASAVLAACATAPQHWEKPGASAAAVQEDSEQCRVQANLAPVPPRHAPVRAGSRTATTAILARQEELAASETEAFQKCMSAKGYSLKR